MSYHSGSRMPDQTSSEPPVAGKITNHQQPSARDSLSVRHGTRSNDNALQSRKFHGDDFGGSGPGRDFSRVKSHTGGVIDPRPIRRCGLAIQGLFKNSPLDYGACGNCTDPAATQHPASDETATQPAAPTPETAPKSEPAQAVEEAAPEAEAAPRGLIVDDNATVLGSGQMRKSDFLSRLRSEVNQAAEAAMAGTGRTTADCPYLQYWFGYYARQDSAHIERAIGRYVPETAGVTSAEGYISIITGRVRGAVAAWLTTGEITGVPDGVPTSVPGESNGGGADNTSPAVGPVMRKAKSGNSKRADTPREIQNRLGRGRPLEGGVRSRMESAFGRSFSQVRAHTDSTAARLANDLNARAFTVGHHVAFDSGEYKPGNMLGDALIAHEMAHVVQQSGAAASGASMGKEFQNMDALEIDADRSAASVLVSLWSGAKEKLESISSNSIPRLKSGLQLQRCCDDSHLPTGLLPLKLPDYDCSPTAATLDEVEKASGKKGAFGLTKMADIGFHPKMEGSFGGKCEAKLIKTPVFAHNHFMYTKAGTYDIGKETPNRGRCRRKALDQKIVVTVPMAEKIKKGEIEHCNDDRRAFALTYGRYAVAIKELQAGYCAVNRDCDPKLKQHFKERTGIDYAQSTKVARCLFDKSGLRDSKDWHTVVVKNPVYDRRCKVATYTPDHKKQLKEVDKHSSESLVKGCGEP